MVDVFDTQTIEMFPVERAQAIFQEWMRPFLDDDSRSELNDQESE